MLFFLSPTRPRGWSVHRYEVKSEGIKLDSMSTSLAEDSSSVMHDSRGNQVCSDEASSSPPTLELAILTAKPTSLVLTAQEYNGSEGSKSRTNLQLATLCYSMFLLGFQDGTLGPLLPVIQRIYHVGPFRSLSWKRRSLNRLNFSRLILR